MSLKLPRFLGSLGFSPKAQFLGFRAAHSEFPIGPSDRVAFRNTTKLFHRDFTQCCPHPQLTLSPRFPQLPNRFAATLFLVLSLPTFFRPVRFVFPLPLWPWPCGRFWAPPPDVVFPFRGRSLLSSNTSLKCDCLELLFTRIVDLFLIALPFAPYRS